MSYRPKLVFISSTAVATQVKFCRALQHYFVAEFWFYEEFDRSRGAWWRVDLEDHCKVLKNVMFNRPGSLEGKYLAPGLSKDLEAFNPDVVMLGGFSIPSNFLAYRWAKKNKKRTIVFTERSRNQHGVIRKRGVIWRLIGWIYRDVDMVMTTNVDAVEQFRDEFRFGDKVVAGRYPADLDAYFVHQIRQAKPAYTYLFANRLTEIYNPIGAIEMFYQILAKYPGSKLLMNTVGELGKQCREKIKELKINNAVEFLTNINSWDNLHTVYARSDILILPAKFSNGNYTILEAMASGMGLVVSERVLGMGELIKDGVNCFSCQPTTSEFLSRIECYIDDPQLFKKHANLNRPMVKHFAPEGTAKFFSELVMKKFYPQG